MEIFVDGLFDAITDTLKALPFLFLAYLLVAFLSHDHSHKFSKILSKNSKSSVFYASVLGCVPQCGFSSVMADLYSQKKVSLGTLVAVFVATSDEAIPLMISNPESVLDLLILIATKVVLAIFWGYAIDLATAAILRARNLPRKKRCASSAQGQNSDVRKLEENCDFKQEILAAKCSTNENSTSESNLNQGNLNEGNQNENKLNETRGKPHGEIHAEIQGENFGEEHEGESHGEEHHHCGHVHTASCDSHCGHSHGDCCGNNILAEAFDHTFTIAIYMFVATFILNLIIGYCGTGALESILTTNSVSQVFIAALVGMIPNCAASVLLVELFISGLLTFPALVAGLTAGAGVGLIILFTRNKKRPLANFGILVLQYAIGVVSGLLLTLFL